MARELTAPEREYIDKYHAYGKDAEWISQELKGVGPVGVQTYLDTRSTPVAEVTDVANSIPEVAPAPNANDNTPQKSTEEQERLRQMNLADSPLTAKDLMAGGPERGVRVMTENASELVDARKIHSVPDPTPEMLERRKERIHVPFDQSGDSGVGNRSVSMRPKE